jgi:tRNA (cmo5U34)-methyltransferase
VKPSGKPPGRDQVFRDPQPQIVDFVFDAQVAAVFPDMIRRSVPGYETLLPLTGLLAARHAQTGTRCYDLGCSLGATSLAVARALDAAKVKDCPVIAVDNSADMLAEAARLLPDMPRIQWLQADITELDLEPASVVIMNYTLQFVAPEDRLQLLQRIREALLPGGVLLLAEKICFEDADLHDYMNSLHLDFKRANGYSELEISQKRTALEHVMRPDTLATHLSRLSDAGFARSLVWFQCLNWAGLIAFADR